MKKQIIIYSFLLVAFGLNGYGQQVNAYKYSLSDDYLLNPAYVGANNYYSINMGVDQRFSGLGSLSPETAFISIHSKVGKGYLFDKDGKINKFFSKFGNSALGIQFFQYKFGPQTETNIGFTYGHHIKLTPPFQTKNPRRLILALTVRPLQTLRFNVGDLYYKYEGDELIATNADNKIRYSLLNADVGALYQTIHADVGLSVLNIGSVYHSDILESLDSASASVFDTIYSPLLAFNGRLKHFKIVDQDTYLAKLIPSVAAFYAVKRNTIEVQLDLAMENTFYKIIANSRKKEYMMGKIGMCFNYTNYWKPTTYMRGYVSVDYKNYILTYSYAYNLNNDIMNLTWGANQITFGIKLNNDRTITGIKRGEWENR